MLILFSPRGEPHVDTSCSLSLPPNLSSSLCTSLSPPSVHIPSRLLSGFTSSVVFVLVTRLHEASQTGEHPRGEYLLASQQTLLTVRVEDEHDHHWVWGQGSITTRGGQRLDTT